MIFGRRGVVARFSFFHQFTIYAIAWLQQLVFTADSLYRSIALHHRSKRYQRLRRGRLGLWLPSAQRFIDGVARIVDRLIVAQGIAPEKLMAHSCGAVNPPSGWTRLGQIVLACALVILMWIYRPSSASAPIDVDRSQAAGASVLAAEAEISDSAPALEVVAQETTAEETTPNPAVDSILAQVTANVSDDEETAPPLVAGRTLPLQIDEVAPLFSEFGSLNAEDAAAAGDESASGDSEESRILHLQSVLEAAIRNAEQTNPEKATESPGTLVVVQPQIQPTANAATESIAAARPSATVSFPYELVLGSAWETFTPRPAAEIDHYWLGLAFPSGYNQFYSPNYQFGSTAGGRYRPHHGVDISNANGAPVIAMAAGEVIHAGPDNPTLLGPYNNFYGNSVVILLDRKLPTLEGDKDVYLLYGHLSEVHAARGQRIEVGDPVGAVGMTGIAIGPHLHIEVRVGQNSYMTAVNPALWIRPLPGTGTVAVRLLNAEGRSWVGAKVSLLKYEGEGARWVRTIETYRDEERLRSNPLWGENGAISNLDAGSYYIAAEINGEKVGQNITIQDGATTFVELRTNQ